jgi:hypothetical protein
MNRTARAFTKNHELSPALYRRVVDTLALELWRCNIGNSHAESLAGLSGPHRAFYRKLARRAIDVSRGDGIEATCLVCGCTDSQACALGCSWTVVNRLTGVGVCSSCVPDQL